MIKILFGIWRNRYFRTIWIVFLSLYLLVVFLSPANMPHLTDYDVYYIAGNKAVAHKTVYDVEHQDKFKYSPLTAILWGVSFSSLPGKISKTLWYIFSLLLWVILVLLFENIFSKNNIIS
ncbi:MAG: hypothetical protein JXA66_05070, partial [Oligoflexia bacterium]|nr:hypothetical protein [Oligoflexia bacterium]